MASPVRSLSLTPDTYTFPRIFFKHQIRPNPKPTLETNSVTQQTAVITGGNAGIGLECGRLLLSLQLSHLILAVRSIEKGEEAASPLRKLYSTAKIDVWYLDMDSYESIRAFARKCATLPRLDMAILSAGIMNVELEVNSSTGHEEMFQVNYLSTALLALVLLPILKRKTPSGASGRLTLVASGAALIAKLELLYGQEEIRYDQGVGIDAHAQLSKMTKAEDTVINVVDPTFTPGTSFFRNLPFFLRLFAWPLTKLLGTSVNNAAWRYIDAAVSRGKESHGSFVSDWELHPCNKFMDRLWNETCKELDFPGVREALGSLL
ncbi:hypothetical protein BJ170DRAFT_719061 [Xylariales sp. AK1849]|nr:hypothetical protein BJ170DRAFT_719061 [Xylariales sp. AK1849]